MARLIDRYDLSGVGDELVAQWTRPDDRKSLRELADEFNERLVRAALADAGVETITDDVEHLYAVLSEQAGSAGERTQVRRRLERSGVDVDALTDDFVSYQAVRSYLTKHRDAELPEASDDEVRAAEADAIEQLRQRTETVAESKLERLESTDRLRVGPYQVLTDVRVLCEACGTQYDVTDLVESGACDCYDGSTGE